MSTAELLLSVQLEQAGIPFEREYRFAPPRRWRADFRVGPAGGFTVVPIPKERVNKEGRRMSRKIVKRIQRKAMGGTLYGWVYDDGTVRIKADHPSNDPETEIRMAQTAIALLSEKWAEHGLETQVNSFAWRNDPEPAV